MPASLLTRANDILQGLEEKAVTLPQEKPTTVATTVAAQTESSEEPAQDYEVDAHEADQLALFDPVDVDPKTNKVLEQLKHLNLMAMTPMDVMNKMYEWQQKLQ